MEHGEEINQPDADIFLECMQRKTRDGISIYSSTLTDIWSEYSSDYANLIFEYSHSDDLGTMDPLGPLTTSYMAIPELPEDLLSQDKVLFPLLHSYWKYTLCKPSYLHDHYCKFLIADDDGEYETYLDSLRYSVDNMPKLHQELKQMTRPSYGDFLNHGTQGNLLFFGIKEKFMNKGIDFPMQFIYSGINSHTFDSSTIKSLIRSEEVQYLTRSFTLDYPTSSAYAEDRIDELYNLHNYRVITKAEKKHARELHKSGLKFSIIMVRKLSETESIKYIGIQDTTEDHSAHDSYSGYEILDSYVSYTYVSDYYNRETNTLFLFVNKKDLNIDKVQSLLLSNLEEYKKAVIKALKTPREKYKKKLSACKIRSASSSKRNSLNEYGLTDVEDTYLREYLEGLPTTKIVPSPDCRGEGGGGGGGTKRGYGGKRRPKTRTRKNRISRFR